MGELRRAAKVRPEELRHRRKVVEADRWRVLAEDGRPPKLAPDELIGDGMTRRGRFTRIDPLRTGKVWGRNEWIAFGLWVATAGGTGFLAWRREYRRDDD